MGTIQNCVPVGEKRNQEMLDVVSCGKSLRLTSFPDFTVKETKETARRNHPIENRSIDFHFFKGKSLFVQTHVDYGLEFLRIKKVEQQEKICAVRKLRIDRLMCIACPKRDRDELAIGLTSGHIKLFSYKTAEYTTKFKTGTVNNSVKFLDFSSCDDYLASVYESGIINVFGLKTSTRLDTITLDKSSLLARFHPVKRFHLAIASYKGAVTVYDIHAKRTNFQFNEAHAAPCYDVCMSATNPHCLITAGYDCVINIFDTRKKTLGGQIQHDCPFSTVSLADCGQYCCVGNLKGELIAYDFRNTKSTLNVRKVHDVAVVRCAFVPQNFEADNNNTSNAMGESSMTALGTSMSEMGTVAGDSSTGDFFFEFSDNVASNVSRNRPSTGHRDSFWELGKHQLNTTAGNLELSSLDEAKGRSSLLATESDTQQSTKDRRSTNSMVGMRKSLGVLKTKIDNLGLIHEESGHAKDGELKTRRPTMTSSTPEENNNKVRIPYESICIPDHEEGDNGKAGGDDDCDGIQPDAKPELVANDRPSIPSSAVLSELASFKSEMMGRVNGMESLFRHELDILMWKMYSQNFGLWYKQQGQIEAIKTQLETSMGLLLQSDPFVSDYLNLKRENAALKSQLAQGNESSGE